MEGQIFIPNNQKFIKKIEFRPYSGIEIEFAERDKGTILYYIDDFSLYDKLISAPSVGKFWHTNIKDKFNYKRLK